jgi:hypothetical protein
MEKVIVFDFDKTLTNYDSALPFYLFCSKYQPYKFFNIPLFIFIKFLSKFKFITVKKEKEIGIKLFCPTDFSLFKNRCVAFSKTVTLNNIYHIEYKSQIKPDVKLIIASASFQYILEKLFSEATIIGTTLEIDINGKINGINQHPFREEKAMLLKSSSWSTINCFYTDSENDLPTVKIAEKTVWVKNGKIL